MSEPSLGITMMATTQRKASGVTSAKHFDHLMRRRSTIDRLAAMFCSVTSGSSWLVPRASSALSKVPPPSTGWAPPARACQRSSSKPLAGTMCLRIDR